MGGQSFRLALMAAGMAGACVATAAQSDTQNIGRLHQAWRAAIAHKAVPAAGCFTASYPAVVWRQVACGTAPQIPYFPRANGSTPAGGDGDYIATTSVPTSAATGWFPVVERLKWEHDTESPQPDNSYSLQINSNNIPHDKACADASTPDICYGWQQFVYSSTYGFAFMQYWLVYFNPTPSNPCPPGWANPLGTGNCFINSAAVAVPLQVITELPNMSLEGSAVKYGIDTLTLTTSTQAYATTGEDSMLALAKNWTSSEFNVLGEGGSSEAVFNPGAWLTVQLDISDRGRRPSCTSGFGSTAETNNLTLGARCWTARGSGAMIRFVESLPK